MKHMILSAAGRALRATRSGRLVILIYHRVRPRPDDMFPGEVDRARFDRQMQLLARHFSPLRLQDAVAGLRGGDLPPRAVAITFDDGYADNAEAALPILRRHGVPATFFIATAFLDGGRMWNDSIIETVRRCTAEMVELPDIGLRRLELGDGAARGQAAQRIIDEVKHLRPDARQAAVGSICERLGGEPELPLMMTTAQVRELSEAGMEIGAHTHSHPILRTLDAAAATDEIVGGRQRLEAIIGRPVDSFAYPNGRPDDDYTTRDRDLVARLGFRLAVSTRRGAATAASDPFQLPRFTPWDGELTRWCGRLLWEFRNAN